MAGDDHARSPSAKGNNKVRARSMEARVVNASHSAEKWSPSSSASDIVKSIHAMLHPRNIVLVGATDKPGNYAERIWNNLIRYQYEGGLFPVNAKREAIWG